MADVLVSFEMGLSTLSSLLQSESKDIKEVRISGYDEQITNSSDIKNLLLKCEISLTGVRNSIAKESVIKELELCAFPHGCSQCIMLCMKGQSTTIKLDYISSNRISSRSISVVGESKNQLDFICHGEVDSMKLLSLIPHFHYYIATVAMLLSEVKWILSLEMCGIKCQQEFNLEPVSLRSNFIKSVGVPYWNVHQSSLKSAQFDDVIQLEDQTASIRISQLLICMETCNINTKSRRRKSKSRPLMIYLVDEDWKPTLNLGAFCSLNSDYIPSVGGLSVNGESRSNLDGLRADLAVDLKSDKKLSGSSFLVICSIKRLRGDIDAKNLLRHHRARLMDKICYKVFERALDWIDELETEILNREQAQLIRSHLDRNIDAICSSLSTILRLSTNSSFTKKCLSALNSSNPSSASCKLRDNLTVLSSSIHLNEYTQTSKRESLCDFEHSTLTFNESLLPHPSNVGTEQEPSLAEPNPGSSFIENCVQLTGSPFSKDGTLNTIPYTRRDSDSILNDGCMTTVDASHVKEVDMIRKGSTNSYFNSVNFQCKMDATLTSNALTRTTTKNPTINCPSQTNVDLRELKEFLSLASQSSQKKTSPHSDFHMVVDEAFHTASVHERIQNAPISAEAQTLSFEGAIGDFAHTNKCHEELTPKPHSASNVCLPSNKKRKCKSSYEQPSSFKALVHDPMLLDAQSPDNSEGMCSQVPSNPGSPLKPGVSSTSQDSDDFFSNIAMEVGMWD